MQMTVHFSHSAGIQRDCEGRKTVVAHSDVDIPYSSVMHMVRFCTCRSIGKLIEKGAWGKASKFCSTKALIFISERRLWSIAQWCRSLTMKTELGMLSDT